MRHLKLTLAYDGTNYAGWQVQPNGPTIQAAMEKAWADVTSESLRITASGRTDSGVHALGQICSVGTESTIANDALVRALNTFLPDDICVLDIEDAPENFHAIYDATHKHYQYRIQLGPLADVFQRHFCWHLRRLDNIQAMQVAAGYLVGQHDFAAFQAAGSDRLTTVRTVTRLELQLTGEAPYRFLTIDICADGFLYNMVRNIVGTLVEIGFGRRPPEWINDVLASGDRRLAGQTAPPQGLFLVDVTY